MVHFLYLIARIQKKKAMTRKSLLTLLFSAGIGMGMVACLKTKRVDISPDGKPYCRVFDTLTVKTWETGDFAFAIKTLVDPEFGTQENTFTVVRLKSDSEERFLFDCHPLFGNIEYLEEGFFAHVSNDLWWFPYCTGGNYCRATGYNLIEIQPDRVKYLGQVGGYEDIDGESLKDFWVYVVTDYLNKSCSEYGIDKMKVEIIKKEGLNDTLSYTYEGTY